MALPDPSVTQNQPTAAPTATASAPVAPSVPPTVNPVGGALPAATENAQPSQPPKESFKQSFAEGYNGAVTPNYTTDENGNVVSTAPARHGLGGILGGVLAGALRGMNDAMAAQVSPDAKTKGAAFSAGAAAAKQAAEQRDLKARAVAQQNFENNQAVTAAKVRNNMELAQTALITQNMNFAADLHAGVKRAQDLDNQAAELRIRGVNQQLLEEGVTFRANLAKMGIDPTPFTGWSPELTAQIPSLVSGASRAVHNGKQGEGNGVDVYPTSELQSHLITKPVEYNTYDGAIDKDGVPIPTKHVMSAGINPATGQPYNANDYTDAYFAGQAQLVRLTQKAHSDMTAQQQKADLDKTQAAADESRAAAGEAKARAGLTEAQTQQLQRQAADIAKPDATGFSSPLSVTEYNKRYDKLTASKPYQNLQQMNQSYQQFQDTLRDINSGKDMTGAQSVVGLFNAIGISAEPLAGKGFRINSNTIEEHIGARGLNQAAYQKLLKLKNGDVITPDQMKDYANIAALVYENAYVNEAAEAHREGLPADFLPQGGGMKVDTTTARIYTRVILQAHPELAKDPAKLKQSVTAAEQANGWSF
jgi:hypothetical protein